MDREKFAELMEYSPKHDWTGTYKQIEDLNKTILRKHGPNDCFTLFFEESAELTQELCKFIRDDKKKDMYGVIEELADLSIVLARIHEWVSWTLEGVTDRDFDDIMTRAIEIKFEELKKKHII